MTSQLQLQLIGSFGFLLCMSVICLLLAIGGLWLVRRFFDHKELMGHHDVAGFLLTIVGTLYAVVLGLIVVGSLNKFQQARVTVEHEANSLHDIFHLASGVPDKLSVDIQASCISYAKTVIDEEWKTMEVGEHSEKAHLQMQRLSHLITMFRPSNAGEANIQAAMLDELDEVGDCRHTRLLDATPQIDPYIWSALFAGGGVLVVFTYFFGVERFSFQVLMTALVTSVLAINLIIVALYSSPYSGDIKVSSNAFSSALQRFSEERQAATPAAR